MMEHSAGEFERIEMGQCMDRVLFGVAALLFLAGMASAAEPLSNAQMDRVSAGDLLPTCAGASVCSGVLTSSTSATITVTGPDGIVKTTTTTTDTTTPLSGPSPPDGGSNGGNGGGTPPISQLPNGNAQLAWQRLLSGAP